MRIYLLVLALMGMFTSARAQLTDFPTYEEIEAFIQIESSDLFYPTLLDRYVAGDSTMNAMEKVCVYYGYIFQDDYDPIHPSSHLATLKESMMYDQSSMPDYEDLIVLTQAMLEENPFDIQALNFQLYFYKKLEDSDNAAISQAKITILTDAIIQSSNGNSLDDPYLVIHPKHEMAFVYYKDLTYLGEQTSMNDIQYMKVSNDGTEFLMYFDIEPVLNFMSNM